MTAGSRLSSKPCSPNCARAENGATGCGSFSCNCPVIDGAVLHGIGSIHEALADLAHNLLGLRSELEAWHDDGAGEREPFLHAIFGSPDDLKFRSCTTLFSRAADDRDNPFRQGLDGWCGGRPDEQTLALIDAGGGGD